MSLVAPSLILALAILESTVIHAQISYDPKTNHILCPTPNTQYCAAASLQSSSIISCMPQGTVEIRSCNIELSGVLPVGYEGAAVCCESSFQSGDAVCAFNGTGYTLEGLEVNVPETVLCDDTPPFPFIGSFAENHSDREGDGKGDRAGTIGDPYGSQPSVSILREDRNPGQYSSYFPVLSVPRHISIPAPGISITSPLPEATPSASHRTSADNGLIAICSNPWSREDTKTADILTLNIVLVIPTTRVKGPDTQSEPSSSTTLSACVITTASPEVSANLTPSCNTPSGHGISLQGTPTSSNRMATLTLWGDATMGSDDKAGVHASDTSNSGNILRTKTVMLTAVAVLVLALWAGAGALFG
ncbi:hypothetical protein BDW66DRAFT_146847 [Aspergillus desertorum]